MKTKRVKFNLFQFKHRRERNVLSNARANGRWHISMVSNLIKNVKLHGAGSLCLECDHFVRNPLRLALAFSLHSDSRV